jgi:tRNA G18 (ribose-2'-O)-methylase SpoU
MGSIFQISLAKIENVLPTLLSFKQENKKIFALSLPQKESTYLKKMRTIGEIQKEGNFILIVGNEAEGIQKNLLDISDHLIYIPMKNQIDSLNVSHALAVALSHILPT